MPKPLSSRAEAMLILNTLNPASQARWDGKHKDTGPWKASQSWRKPSCIDQTEPKLSAGFTARPLELVTLRQVWAFPYSRNKPQCWNQYHCTVLLRTEKTRDINDATGQSCPSSEVGLPPSTSLYSISLRKWQNFSCNIKRDRQPFFFFWLKETILI